MDETDAIRMHAIVEGRVQGVGFRAFVQGKASDLGLTGWVRNRWNGTVELVAEGERTDLEQLLAAVRVGPRSSNVTGVNPEWSTPTGEFNSFRVKMTG